MEAVGPERAPGGRDRDRVAVDAVGDDPAAQPLVSQREPGESGVAVREAAHRVEQVRDTSRTGLDRSQRLRRRGVAVPERHANTSPYQHCDERQHARQLGRDGHDKHAVAPTPRSGVCVGDSAERLLRVSTGTRRVQERSLQVQPQRLRSLVLPRSCRQRPLGRCHDLGAR